jgi:hypothetical protein
MRQASSSSCHDARTQEHREPPLGQNKRGYFRYRHIDQKIIKANNLFPVNACMSDQMPLLRITLFLSRAHKHPHTHFDVSLDARFQTAVSNRFNIYERALLRLVMNEVS